MIKLAYKLEYWWLNFKHKVLGLPPKVVECYCFNVEVPADGYEKIQQEYSKKPFYFFNIQILFNGQVMGNIASRQVFFIKDFASINKAGGEIKQ